jgi:hypothetical protein
VNSQVTGGLLPPATRSCWFPTGKPTTWPLRGCPDGNTGSDSQTGGGTFGVSESRYGTSCQCDSKHRVQYAVELSIMFMVCGGCRSGIMNAKGNMVEQINAHQKTAHIDSISTTKTHLRVVDRRCVCTKQCEGTRRGGCVPESVSIVQSRQVTTVVV